MANTLRFKRGLVSGIPTAALGEPLFTTDTFDLYIGNGTGNTRFQKYIASGTTSQLLRGDGSLLTMPIVLTSPSNGQVLKYDGTNWVNSSDAGVTGSGTAGQVTYWNGTGTITGSNNLFYDATNNRLGVKTNTPSYSLSVSGGMSLGNDGGIGILWQNSSAFRSSGTIFMDYGQGGSGDFQFRGGSSLVNVAILYNNGYINLAANGQRVGINQASPIVPLDVNGAMAVGGVLGAHQTDRLILEYNANKSAIRAYGNTAGSGILAFNTGGGGGSNDTERMRIHAGGNVSIGSISDNGLRFQVTGDGYFSGSVGIGSASFLSNNSLRVAKNITGNNQSYGVSSSGQIQSDVTVQGHYFITSANTQATAFTLSNLYHYSSTQGTFGASSAVSNQYGFFVDSTLVGATNNYGFYGNIASGTGRWNLYMNGSAANYLAGQLLIGTTTTSSFPLDVNGAIRSSGLITAATEFRLNNQSFTRVAIADNGGGFAGGYNLALSSGITPIHDSTGAISGIHYRSPGTIQFYTGGSQTAGTTATERMRLDASGNLGLGVTPSGSVRLEVNGAARLGTGTATVGATTLEQTYSGDNVLGVISAYLGTGAMILGYGIKAKTSADAFISTFDNFTGRRAAFSINQGYFEFFNTAAVNTAKGSDVAATSLMRLHTTGNLVLGGTTSTDAGFRLDVNGTMRVSGASTFSSNATISGNLGIGTSPSYRFHVLSAGTDIAAFSNTTGNSLILFTNAQTTADLIYRFRQNNGAGNFYDLRHYGTANTFAIDYNGTSALTIASTGAATFSSSLTVDTDTFFVDATNNRVGVGTITPSYKAHIVNNASNTPTYLALQNSTAGISSAAVMKVISDASSGSGEFLKKSSTGSTYKVMTSNDLVIYNDTAGDIDIFNDHANGKINLTSGGSSSTQLTLDTSGRLGFSNASPTAYCDLAASTTAIASLRIRSGSAPTAPNDGDIWFDGTDLKMRIGGVTKTFTLV